MLHCSEDSLLCKFSPNLVDDAKFSQTDYYAWNYSKSGRILLILECISLEVLALHALNRGGIPLPPHSIDIFPYACDVNIDTKLLPGESKATIQNLTPKKKIQANYF